MTGTALAALELRGVSIVRDGRTLVDGVDWVVERGQRWAVLGPNGSGKSTLLRVASMYLHPTRGRVVVAGQELGRTDVRRLRARVGLASPALLDQLRLDLVARDVVMTARYAALEPWWHTYDDEDRARADRLLDQLGVVGLADRRLGTLSSGERQRVLLARAFAGDPVLVLLDEPTAGLDLGGREDLVTRLGRLAEAPDAPPTVLVTHHVEEIPTSTTHVLLLRQGQVVAAGPVADVLTADQLSATFGLDLTLERRGPRWTAWSA